MTGFKLVSIPLCPYVQRAAIVLTEKKVPFEREYVDLAQRPDWFVKTSPLGKVPLLLTGNDVLFESSVIVEYLEDTTEHPLHPKDPVLRAKHRAWMEFGSSILADIWSLETTGDQKVFDAKTGSIAGKLERLNEALGEGPYFQGKDFCMVDAVFGPVFRYFDVFEDCADFRIARQFDKINAWRRALTERPSVKAAVVPEYPDLLRAFLRKHNGVMASRMAA